MNNTPSATKSTTRSRTLRSRTLARSLSTVAPAIGLGVLAIACSSAPGGELDGRSSQAISYSAYPPATAGVLGAADLANLYDIPTFLPANSTIAILMNDGDDPNAEEDLEVYRSAFSLPSCTSVGGCLTKVTEIGATTNLPAGGAWAGTHFSEALDMASAGCPSCKLLVVEMNPNDTPMSFPVAIATAKKLGASAMVSTATWTTGASGLPADSTFTQPGITVFSSMAWTGLGNYPAFSPGVVAVGLTTASLGTQAAPTPTETANSIVGSACTAFPKPSWQHDTGCAGRTANDVSAQGGPVWTFNTYSSLGGSSGWIASPLVDGPIVASSLVAAIFAQTGNGGGGPSAPYLSNGYFNDVTLGADGTCAGYMCNATVGYDAPTGLGTPNGLNMAGINREFLDFSVADIYPWYPTLGTQGTHRVTIQAGQTLDEWLGTYTPWASGQTLSLSFSDPAPGLSGALLSQTLTTNPLTQTETTNPGANFELTASPSAVPGTQSTMVITATAGGASHSIAIEMNVVACVPAFTSCGSLQACGSVTNNCGQTFACGTCSSGDSCSNGMCCPGSEVATDGMCCPPDSTVSLGHCCPAGDNWLPSANACRPPVKQGGGCKGTTCT